ncbi:hypothetical protein ACGFIY_21630 [Micromonospora chersina]|uniref:hypothetical protein n=1 Tax=Micromonospora chersina TaxID=47854 RepID=UPI00371DF88C
MARTPDEGKPVSTGIGWAGALVVIIAGLYPAFHGVYWAIPVTAAATAAALGTWKAAQLLGMMLNHMHWRDVEVPATDD